MSWKCWCQCQSWHCSRQRSFLKSQTRSSTSSYQSCETTRLNKTSSRPGYTSMPSLMNSLPMRAASFYGADHRHLELGPCSAFQALPRSTAVEMPAVLAISTPFLAPDRGRLAAAKEEQRSTRGSRVVLSRGAGGPWGRISCSKRALLGCFQRSRRQLLEVGHHGAGAPGDFFKPACAPTRKTLAQRPPLLFFYVLRSNCAGRAVKTLPPLAKRQEHKASASKMDRTSILIVCLSPTVLMSSTLPPRPDMPQSDRPKPMLGLPDGHASSSSCAPSPGFHATCPPERTLVGGFTASNHGMFDIASIWTSSQGSRTVPSSPHVSL